MTSNEPTSPDAAVSLSQPAPEGVSPAPQASSQAASALPADVYIIPRALAQATLDYLAMHPYREVVALVRGFEALEPLSPDGRSTSQLP
jgi:hypothetical protein